MITPHGLVTTATAADARELAASIRLDDKRELEEVGNRPVLSTLLFGVLASRPALTLRTHSGDLIGMAGAVPSGGPQGIVWMAGTPLIEDHRAAFLRGSRDVLRELHSQFDTLYNVCDARNPVHQRWLRWLGFTFLRKIDRFGPNGVPVMEFARIAT